MFSSQFLSWTDLEFDFTKTPVFRRTLQIFINFLDTNIHERHPMNNTFRVKGIPFFDKINRRNEQPTTVNTIFSSP